MLPALRLVIFLCARVPTRPKQLEKQESIITPFFLLVDCIFATRQNQLLSLCFRVKNGEQSKTHISGQGYQDLIRKRHRTDAYFVQPQQIRAPGEI